MRSLLSLLCVFVFYNSLFLLWILAEPAAPFQLHHSEESLSKDAAVHLRSSQFAVHENNRHFGNLESALVSRELHFNLECIAFELDFVQFDGFKYLTAVAFESGSSVVDRQASDEAYVLRCEVRHQYTAHRPVHYIHTAYVARTDGHIITLVGTLGVKAWKIGWSMAEVGIHFENVVILMFYGPFESGNVGSTQTQLTLALYHKEAVGELGLHMANDVGCAVGRVVLDDEDVEIFLEGEHRTDNVLDVLLFIIGWYNDDAV